MSNDDFYDGEIVEVYFSNEIWIKAVVTCGSGRLIKVIFPNGMTSSVEEGFVKRISPLTLLAQQAD